MSRSFLVYILFLLSVGLAACGQKGPLYLPVTPPRTIPPMPNATTHAPSAATSSVPAAASQLAPPTAAPH